MVGPQSTCVFVTDLTGFLHMNSYLIYVPGTRSGNFLVTLYPDWSKVSVALSCSIYLCKISPWLRVQKSQSWNSRGPTGRRMAQSTQNGPESSEYPEWVGWPGVDCPTQMTLIFMILRLYLSVVFHDKYQSYKYEAQQGDLLQPRGPRKAQNGWAHERYLKPCTCRLTEWEWSKSDRLSWLGCLIFLQTATASPLWMDDPRPQCTSRSFYSTGCLYLCLNFYLYSSFFYWFRPKSVSR